jgi:indole-3-glycerol phosphate synthase
VPVANVLDEILASKRVEIERARVARPVELLKALPGYAVPRRNFFGTVSAPRAGRPNLIAEIKRASPSAGVIRADFDPVAIARTYAAAGAAALSVLTDEPYFGGRLEHIDEIKAAVGLPVLRKDFLLDEYQIHESRAYGADAVLLIAEAMEPVRLVALADLARQLGLCVLLEVHARPTLMRTLSALDASNRANILLGLNNRDLQAQRVDLATTERLAELVPPGMPIVAESGIRTRRDVERMHAAGARALLVGETLMRSADPAATIRELFGAPTVPADGHGNAR